MRMCKSLCNSLDDALELLTKRADEKRRIIVRRHGNSGRIYVPAHLVGKVVDKYVIRNGKRTIVLIVSES